MEQKEVKEQSVNQAAAGHDVTAITPSQEDVAISPPAEEASCPTCAGGEASVPMSCVYAPGRIEARFPRLSVEKEFAQVAGRSETAGKTDQQVFHAVLSKRENRYLARQMCWVLTIQGLETYILHPRDPVDLERLVEAIRPAPSPNDIDVVVGIKGPIAPPELCNGLMVPIVAFDQIYSLPLSATRKIVEAIFSYTNRNTDFTEKFFVRVDVTEEFPFLVTKLSPYFDR